MARRFVNCVNVYLVTGRWMGPDSATGVELPGAEQQRPNLPCVSRATAAGQPIPQTRRSSLRNRVSRSQYSRSTGTIIVRSNAGSLFLSASKDHALHIAFRVLSRSRALLLVVHCS
jgi:hypothetical protein